MKNALFISIILLTSCKSKHRDQDELLLKNLTGKWTMCTTTYVSAKKDTSRIMRNVCPHIVFKKDNNADIKMGEDVVAVFKWKIANKKLIVNASNKDSFILSGQYDISIDTQLKEITLSAQKGPIKAEYLLNR